MTKWIMRPAILLAVLLVAYAGPAGAAGILFSGTDTEDFASTFPDHLGRAITSGATVGLSTSIPLGYHLNGIANAGGFLYAGSALGTELRSISFLGVTLSGPTAGVFAGGCCMEDMALVGGVLYRGEWSTSIRSVNPVTGATIGTFAQSDVVGMELIGSDIWISKWAGQTVGKWDPGTNTYTPMFSLAGVGAASNVGGLAWDSNENVLWVGRQGGAVEPYSLAGVSLGPSFSPFGVIPDTVDSLAFEPVPEPGTLLLLGSGLAGMAGAAWRKRRRQ